MADRPTDEDLTNAARRAEVVQRIVPPPEDDNVTWRFAAHLVAADSVALIAEVRRLRAGISSHRTVVDGNDQPVVAGTADKLLWRLVEEDSDG